MSRLTWKLGPPASPSTSSVEPPPMSMTSTERISERPSVAPRKAKRASSFPESNRTLKPNRRSTSLRNSPPFEASRTALVAIASAATGTGASLTRDERSGARQDRLGLGERLLDQAHSCSCRTEPFEADLQPLESLPGRLELFVGALAGPGDSLQLDAERSLEALQGLLRLERAHERDCGARDGRDDENSERDPEDDHGSDATNPPGMRLAARCISGTKSPPLGAFLIASGRYFGTTPRACGLVAGGETRCPSPVPQSAPIRAVARILQGVRPKRPIWRYH